MLKCCVDTTHLAWHEEALQLGGKVGVISSVLRQCGRQCNRDNMPAEESETYYRRTLAISFLDQLIVEMKARFSKESCTWAKSCTYTNGKGLES